MPYKFKRNSQVIGKIEAPQHLSRLNTNGTEKNNCSLFTLPRESSQNAVNNSTSWSRNTTASDSWSEELEDVATQKILEEWDNVENFIHDEKSETINESMLEECTQWKLQIPHLRVLGERVVLTQEEENCDIKSNDDEEYLDTSSRLEDLSSQMINNTSRQEDLKKVKTKVIDIIFKYVTLTLNTKSEQATDCLTESIDQILKITPTPIHDNKIQSNSKQSTRKAREDLNVENELKNELENREERRASSCKKNQINHDPLEKRLHTTPSARNKRGTVFNERIIVSPVPYVVSTRESFCTLKTTSVRFMGEAVEYSVPPRPRKNTLQVFNTCKNKTGQDFLTGWEPPVYPTVWPKNVKLAPIDVNRLHSSKKRSTGLSATVTPRSRSQIILPAISHTKCNNDGKKLEIHGKHIFGQTKSNVFSTNYEYNCKKSQKQNSTKKY